MEEAVLIGHQIADGPADEAGPFAEIRTSKARFERAISRYTSKHERVILTLDDGFAANMDFVVNTVRRHEVPLVVFLTTGFVNRSIEPYELQIASILENGDSFRYESLRLPLKNKTAYERAQAVADLAREHGVTVPKLADELYLSWDQIRELDQETLIEFGAHSVTHPVLSRLAPHHAWREVRDSKREIEEQLGHEIGAFAYPYGHASPIVTALVRVAGFQRAFVTDQRPHGRFRIGRIDINHEC